MSTNFVFSVPVEKLISLLDDIFEAEDNLPPDCSINDLPTEFFSPMTVDCARPFLQPVVIRKIALCISHVARPMKRIRHGTSAAMSTPRGKGRMREVDTKILSRILRILKRTIAQGEDLDPFPHTASAAKASTSASPKKGKKSKGKEKEKEERGKSRSPTGEEEEVAQEVTNEDLNKLSRHLELARDTILAADCCIALLASDRLTKEVSCLIPLFGESHA